MIEKVREGVMLGKTPKLASPMRPREVEVRATGEMGQPRFIRSAKLNWEGDEYSGTEGNKM